MEEREREGAMERERREKEREGGRDRGRGEKERGLSYKVIYRLNLVMLGRVESTAEGVVQQRKFDV